MRPRLTITRDHKSEWDVFTLSGGITEDAGAQLLALYNDSGRRCRFVFKDVQMINSNGIRAWMLFLRDFQTDRELELAECSPVIVSQINMLPSFIQRAKVVSLYVPYNCNNCKISNNVLLEAKDYPTSTEELKPSRCKKCHGPTKVDTEEEIFAFLARRQS